MDKYKFGNYICKLREEHNLTQAEFAKELDVSDKAVSKWENGQAIPRMDTFENIAKILDTTVEDLLAAGKENTSRVYFVNEFCSIMHLNVDGQLHSIKLTEGKWIEVNPGAFHVSITGDLDFDEIIETEDEQVTLKDKLIVKVTRKLAHKAASMLIDLILQADCTYKFTKVPDGSTITISYDAFSLGDKAMVYQDFMLSYPKIEGENINAELLSAKGKNKNQVIKAYKKLGLQSDIGMDFIIMILSYPIRTIYFRYLCRPDVIKRNILNVEKHKEIDAKRTEKKKHGCFKAFGIALLILIFLIFIEPSLFVDSDRPALVSSDFSTITMYGDVYRKIDELPFGTYEYKVLGASVWEDARFESLSRWDQALQDDKVQIFEDNQGYVYLWLVRDYTDTIFTDTGIDKEYDDFETHEVYKSEEPLK